MPPTEGSGMEIYMKFIDKHKMEKKIKENERQSSKIKDETPVIDQLERKNELSELYSKLAPYAGWQTNFTNTEMHTNGSHATVGVSLGASAGRRSAKEELHTQQFREYKGKEKVILILKNQLVLKLILAK